jgi:decaprenyl-phosphate phosphoribosyltransferase
MSLLLAFIEIIRPYQWIKNIFILAPLMFSGRMLEIELVWLSISAFIMFCLASSSVYVFNDLQDIESDKKHKKKRNRPLPSGRLKSNSAWVLLIILLGALFLSIITINPPKEFIVIIISYMIINLGYSLGLKHVAVLEMIMISVGFILRLLAGAIIIEESLTDWIVITTGLLALMLTAGKRRGDIVQKNDAQNARRSLEQYTVPFLDHVITALVGAIIVTYLLFCISDYASMRFGPYILWTTIPVIMGIIRFQQIIIIESDGGDPTEILYKDRMIQSIVLVWGVLFLGLIYGVN